SMPIWSRPKRRCRRSTPGGYPTRRSCGASSAKKTGSCGGSRRATSRARTWWKRSCPSGAARSVRGRRTPAFGRDNFFQLGDRPDVPVAVGFRRHDAAAKRERGAEPLVLGGGRVGAVCGRGGLHLTEDGAALIVLDERFLQLAEHH